MWDKIKEKINWKTIGVIILVFLYINSCTSNCTKNNKLRVNNITIEQKDSVINSLNNEVDSMKAVINGLNHEIDKRDIMISEKDKSIKGLENSTKRITVKIDTVKRN